MYLVIHFFPFTNAHMFHLLWYNVAGMRYAVISDLHANVSALEAVLADAEREGAECTVCLGDIVGYGPSPEETLAAVRKRCSVVVAGNHDDAVSGRMSKEDFIDLAGDAVERHRAALARDAVAYLKTLPHVAAIEGATVVHGDLTDPTAFRYVDGVEAAADNFRASDFALLFVGHTHVPEIHLTGRSGAVYRIDPQDFAVEEGKRYIVNPGSVGYPRERNGRCLSSYVIYDSDEGTVTYRFLPFSVSSVMQRGKGARRFGWKSVCAAIAAVCIAAGAATYFAATSMMSKEDAPIERKVLQLPPSARYVKANLKVDGDGNPPRLSISFRDTDGKPCGSAMVYTVRHSAAKRVKIPPGATLAEFTVWSDGTGETAKILSFEPEALVSPKKPRD